MQGVPVPPGPVVSFTEARPDGDGEAETPVNGLETSGECCAGCQVFTLVSVDYPNNELCTRCSEAAAHHG